MESVQAALDRALQEQTTEAWDHVDNLAYTEICRASVDADDLREMFALALKIRGFDPEDSDGQEPAWFDQLLYKALSHMERSAAMRSQFAAVQGVMQSIDRNGKLIAVTKPWLDMLGYGSDKEVLGRLSLDFQTPKARQRSIEIGLPQLNRDGFIVGWSSQMETVDGRVIDVTFDSIWARNENGQYANTLCAITHKDPTK